MNSPSLLKATFFLGLITALTACGAYDVAELKEKTIDTTSYSGAVAEAVSYTHLTLPTTPYV